MIEVHHDKYVVDVDVDEVIAETGGIGEGMTLDLFGIATERLQQFTLGLNSTSKRGDVQRRLNGNDGRRWTLCKAFVRKPFPNNYLCRHCPFRFYTNGTVSDLAKEARFLDENMLDALPTTGNGHG